MKLAPRWNCLPTKLCNLVVEMEFQVYFSQTWSMDALAPVNTRGTEIFNSFVQEVHEYLCINSIGDTNILAKGCKKIICFPLVNFAYSTNLATYQKQTYNQRLMHRKSTLKMSWWGLFHSDGAFEVRRKAAWFPKGQTVRQGQKWS